MVAVYFVEYASAALGLNVAVAPLVVTVPATAGEKVNVVAPNELATIGSEKVALMVALRATLTALSAGTAEASVGGGLKGGAEHAAKASVSASAIRLRMIFPCLYR